MQLPKFMNVIILLILPIIFSVSSLPNPLPLKNNACITTIPHQNPKIDRKINKLEKKLKQLKEKEEKGKKGKILIIWGIILLLTGLILILVGVNANNNNDDVDGIAILNGCLTIMLGGALGIAGLIALIVGAAF